MNNKPFFYQLNASSIDYLSSDQLLINWIINFWILDLSVWHCYIFYHCLNLEVYFTCDVFNSGKLKLVADEVLFALTNELVYLIKRHSIMKHSSKYTKLYVCYNLDIFCKYLLIFFNHRFYCYNLLHFQI